MASVDSKPDLLINLDRACERVTADLQRGCEWTEASVSRDGDFLKVEISDLIPVDAYRSPRAAVVCTLETLLAKLRKGGAA